MFENLIDSIGFINDTDPEVAAAMGLELKRQRENLELIASENIVSPAVMAAMGSVLTNKYAEGYPGKRYYGGCQHVDIVEDIARDRLKKIFGAAYANVQPHSGAQANMIRRHLVMICFVTMKHITDLQQSFRFNQKRIIGHIPHLTFNGRNTLIHSSNRGFGKQITKQI